VPLPALSAIQGALAAAVKSKKDLPLLNMSM
jgi:hypothetical protein